MNHVEVGAKRWRLRHRNNNTKGFLHFELQKINTQICPLCNEQWPNELKDDSKWFEG